VAYSTAQGKNVSKKKKRGHPRLAPGPRQKRVPGRGGRGKGGLRKYTRGGKKGRTQLFRPIGKGRQQALGGKKKKKGRKDCHLYCAKGRGRKKKKRKDFFKQKIGRVKRYKDLRRRGEERKKKRDSPT